MFNIGDRIRIKTWDEIEPSLKVKAMEGNPHTWTTAKAKACGQVGKIVDILWSNAYDCNIYSIQFDGMDQPSNSKFDEDAMVLLPAEDEAEWHYEIHLEGNVVIATLYETFNGQTRMVERGYAKIFHDGVIGYAQATSYAMKKLYENINGGTL